MFEWFFGFKRSGMSIEDKSRLGRPSTVRTNENVLKNREIILKNRRRTSVVIVELSGVNWNLVQ